MRRALIFILGIAIGFSLRMIPIPVHSENVPSVQSVGLPNDCAIVATEAYHRVAPAAKWARLLHLDLSATEGHMVCVWQLTPHDPILLYDKFYLGSQTLELQTAQHDAKVIAAAFADALNRANWRHGQVKFTGAHFVE